MGKVYVAPMLSAGLEKFKEIVKSHSESGGSEGKRLVVFCEDRLSLVAERAIAEAVGGTFAVSVYTLSRFLSIEAGRCDDVLTSQGSAMALRKLIEGNRQDLQLFKRLSAANASQEVYDTIALLYSSKISAEDLQGVEAENNLLKRKLHDLQLLYAAYNSYLEEKGVVDRNAYLRRLPDVILTSEKIKGADVLFLGFQAFTSSLSDCVRASMCAADDVFGIFVGGSEKKYVNEAWATFYAIAKETGLKGVERGDFVVRLPSALNEVAEHLRKYAFEPESFHKSLSLGISGGQLQLLQANDEEDECKFIASQILKCVKEDGVRYREISVMMPDVAAVQPALERAFGEYGIPYYVDRRYPLSSHSVCSFILDYLVCAIDGCRPESVFAVVNSPLFTLQNKEQNDAERLQLYKDVFVNYILRAAAYRGGVKRAVNEQICAEPGLDFNMVEAVRQRFLTGLKLIPTAHSDSGELCGAVTGLLKFFGVEERLATLAGQAEESGYHSVAEMSLRACEAVLGVIEEAQKLTSGEILPLKEFFKILKSGFVSAEISLIPPKQDAVFVSDLSTCANTGSKVLFAGGLTDAVPKETQDTAILTDSELSSLEKLKLAVSPKISQVNRRVREITALNLCAFSKKLYLISPSSSNGEECGASEIAGYVKHLFNVGGSPLAPVPVSSLSVTGENFAYTCAKPAPALRHVTLFLSGDKDYGERRIAAVSRFLNENAVTELAKENGFAPLESTVEWSALYASSVSPTALETYYACPYKAFMAQGLRLSERREGAFRPLDSGNFIHAVLEDVATKLNDVQSDEQCLQLAKESAERLLEKSVYAVQSDDGSANYAAGALIEEAQAVALGAYYQIKNSGFKVDKVEQRCKVKLSGGMTVGGRIDRIDSCGDMVRVIDYKTGVIDDSASSYYMGLKLQLALYLSAAAEGKRAAGAYYFPANLEYSSSGVGAFSLRGFMDGSEEVVKSSDTVVEEKQKSAYVGAYLNGRKLDKAMEKDEFAYFLAYSKILAERGASGLTGGKIAPSPVSGECAKCRFGGCCGYDAERQGEREEVSADCKTIASVVRSIKSKGEEQ